MSSDSFRHIVNADPLNLLHAVFEVEAVLGAPLFDYASVRQQVEDLAEAAGRLHTAEMDRADKAEAVATYLFALEGYRGNAENYTDPKNSFPTRILDRKLGLPITLSMLFLEVAQILNLPAYGVGMPGHFIVAVTPENERDEPILLDPFYGGMRLTVEDCAERVSQTTGYQGVFREDWLESTAPDLILIRILNNLRVAYLSQQDWGSAEQVVQLLQIIQPDVAEHIRDEGLIVFQQRRFWRAAHLLERYMRISPHAQDGDAIRQGIADNLDRWVRLN